jgi:hypothetical protein
MPCKPASCTQHSTTSLHLFRLRASSARTLNSELQSCKPNSPATATEMHTFCCHALYDLTGRSFTDLSVPAINTTNNKKTNKTTKTINTTTHKHSQSKQHQHHKLTNMCPLCCHALYLTGRPYTDLSTPAISTTNNNKTNKTTKTANATTHKHSQPKQHQYHKLTNLCLLTLAQTPAAFATAVTQIESAAHTKRQQAQQTQEQRQQQRQAQRPRQR